MIFRIPDHFFCPLESMVTSEKKKHRGPLLKLSVGAIALIAVATLLAGVLYHLQREERSFVSPIEVTGVPEGYVIIGQSHTRAKIRISARAETLDRSDLFRLRANLPEHPGVEGVYPVVLSIPQTSSVDVLGIIPSEISVRLARTVARELPVEVRITGEPAQGYRIGKVTVLPETTWLSGPMETVSTFSSIATTPIAINNASAPLKLKVPAEKNNDPTLTLTPELFTVLIGVEEIQATLSVIGVPVSPAPNDPRQVSIFPGTVDIKVTGPAHLVGTLKASGGATATISTRNLATGMFVRRAAITLPEGVSLIEASPERFTVHIIPNP